MPLTKARSAILPTLLVLTMAIAGQAMAGPAEECSAICGGPARSSQPGQLLPLGFEVAQATAQAVPLRRRPLPAPPAAPPQKAPSPARPSKPAATLPPVQAAREPDATSREALAQATRQVAYTSPRSVDRLLTEFNVLRDAYVDLQSGEVTLVGTYDPAYPSGPLPYFDLLADALQNPYPKFSLRYDPADGALRRVRETIDGEVARVMRDVAYRRDWLRRVLVAPLDGGSDDKRFLEDRLARLGIPPSTFRAYIGWDQQKGAGLQDPAFRDAIGLTTARLLAAVGVEERIGYGYIAFKDLGYAITEKHYGRNTGDPEKLGDKTFRVFQALGMEGDFYRIQEKTASGEYSHDREVMEVFTAIYADLLRGLGMPGKDVGPLMERFRTGRVPEDAVTSKLNPLYVDLVGRALTQNILNGFRFSGTTLGALYPLPPVMSPLELYGARPDSPLMRAFFDGDYTLKFLSHQAWAVRNVPGQKSFEQYLADAAARAGASAGRLPTSGTVRLWIHPGDLQISPFSDGSGVRFGRAVVRIGAEPLEAAKGGDSAGAALFRRSLDDFAKGLTDNYDAYARVYPSLHVVREAEKLVAFARWIQSRGLRVKLAPPAPAGTPLPRAVEGFWGLTYVSGPAGRTDSLYLTVSGGVSFDRQEGEGWMQVAPGVTTTQDVLHQLAASTAFAQQAADEALDGDMDAARELAERSARAMTGEIDLRDLPQVPAPQFTPAAAAVNLAARMDVSRAALMAADRNIQAMRVAEESRAGAEALRTTSPDQYRQAVEAAERVRIRSEQNLQRLRELLAQYGAGVSSPSTIVTALGALDPDAAPSPAAVAGGAAGTGAGGAGSTPAKPRAGTSEPVVDPHILEMKATHIGLAAMVPLPIPATDVSLDWIWRLSAKQTEDLYKAADILLLVYDISGKIGSYAVPVSTVVLVAGKTVIAGADAALVHVDRRNDLIDQALEYLRQGETAHRFAEVMRRLKAGEPIDPVDAGMVAAAKAVLDPDLSASSNWEIVWDAMLSPEARAAMLRKAAIESITEYAGYKIGNKLDDIAADLARRRNIYAAERLIRTRAQHFLKETKDPAARQALEAIIDDSNTLLTLLYKQNVAPAKIASFLAAIPLGDWVSGLFEPEPARSGR